MCKQCLLGRVIFFWTFLPFSDIRDWERMVCLMEIFSGAAQGFCGRTFVAEELSLIREVVEDCFGLSRMELAHTVCELLSWRRPNGSLKARECREFLELLELKGLIRLPKRRAGRPRGSVTAVPLTDRGKVQAPLTGTVRDFAPVLLDLVKKEDERLLWRELVGRYHYLGHTVPFGAHLRYLLWVTKPERSVVGCLQFSSPAWRMVLRDRWIGWDDRSRTRNLQQVANNSRFLLLPWVRIRNLASKVLSLAASRLVQDWWNRYGVRPVLLETLVDPSRYRGSCYRAANWIRLGLTSGRGRMDRAGKRHGMAPKEVFVYPLTPNARKRLVAG